MIVINTVAITVTIIVTIISSTTIVISIVGQRKWTYSDLIEMGVGLGVYGLFRV